MSNTHHPESLVEIGKIVGTHGVKGLLKACIYHKETSPMIPGQPIFLTREPAETTAIMLVRAHPHKNVFLLQLQDIDSLSAAQDLIGAVIQMPADTLKPCGEDEFFWLDLIGSRVFFENRHCVGTLKSIFSTGSNDVFVVETDDRTEILVPALKSVVSAVDTIQKTITVIMPEILSE